MRWRADAETNEIDIEIHARRIALDGPFIDKPPWPASMHLILLTCLFDTRFALPAPPLHS